MSSSSSSSSTTDKIIGKECIKRLVKDVSDLYKNPLHNEGIYYTHNDEDMLKGYALIIGPKDSVYEGGFFCFRFNYPTDYPYSPPRVVFESNDGNVRVHPNLYRSGKVCLSVLNTWQGEGWTSCQTIRSVLLILLSILDENPLLHEPGVKEGNTYLKQYNEILRYFTISHMFLKISSYDYPLKHYHVFYQIIQDKSKSSLMDMSKKVIDIINENKHPLRKRYEGVFYHLSCYVDYIKLMHKLKLRIDELGMSTEYSELGLLKEYDNIYKTYQDK